MRSLIVVLVTALISMPGTALGWGNATHVFVSHRLGAPRGAANMHEMYGSMLVDAFNFRLDSIGAFMSDQTHHQFMAFYAEAAKCAHKSTAFGFVSHSDTWGTDYTAHHNSRTYPGTGYAILKGNELAPFLVPDITSILINGGVDPATAGYIASLLAPEFGHDLAETAVDILVKRNQDPLVGRKIILAATTRHPDIPALLAAAYAEQLSQYAQIPLGDATLLIAAAEREYRGQLIEYGRILMLPEPEALQTLAVVNAAIAEIFLEFYSGVEITVDPAIVAGFLISAMSVVSSDYEVELLATTEYVEQELGSRSIVSCGPQMAKEAEGSPTPTEFSLDGNYPNPFNPTTTITFRVPRQSVITLDIYNVIGQKVRTLVDERLFDAGDHQEMWDGTDIHGLIAPAGVYFSRLSTPVGVFTRKMVLTK